MSHKISVGIVSLITVIGLAGGVPAPKNWGSASAQIPDLNFSLEDAMTVNFEPRPGAGAPDRTTGAGSRGGCQGDAIEPNSPGLTVLSPSSSQLTTQGHPTFFVYVPQTSAQSIEFSVSDANHQEVYYTTQSVKDTSGIIPFKLPEDQPELEVGKTYYLYFAIMCNSTDPSANPHIWGTVQRTEASSQVETALVTEPTMSLKRVALYGQDGLWYDALSTLVNLKETQPNNAVLQGVWTELLKSVGLTSIAQEPLLN